MVSKQFKKSIPRPSETQSSTGGEGCVQGVEIFVEVGDAGSSCFLCSAVLYTSIVIG